MVFAFLSAILGITMLNDSHSGSLSVIGWFYQTNKRGNKQSGILFVLFVWFVCLFLPSETTVFVVFVDVAVERNQRKAICARKIGTSSRRQVSRFDSLVISFTVRGRALCVCFLVVLLLSFFRCCWLLLFFLLVCRGGGGHGPESNKEATKSGLRRRKRKSSRRYQSKEAGTEVRREAGGHARTFP